MLTMFQIRKDRKLNARTNAQELTLDRNYAGSSSSQMVGTAQDARAKTLHWSSVGVAEIS